MHFSLLGLNPSRITSTERPLSPSMSYRSSSPLSPSSSSSTDSSISSHSSRSQHSLSPHPYPSSHAALLSGIRSHALPHALVLEPPPSATYSTSTPSQYIHAPVTVSPTLSSSPQSPPFGPTPITAFTPSALALEVERRSPDLSTDDDVRFRGGVGEGLNSRENGGFGESFEHVSMGSPPLLPVTFGDTLPIPIPIGRPRRGSFGATNSPPSPALQYLEEEDKKATQERRTTSPPPPTSLFSFPATSASPPTPSNIPPVAQDVVGRSRSRSFTTERNFAPNPSPLPTHSSTSAVPTFGLVASPPTSPPLIPSDSHTNFSTDALHPPSSHDVPSPSSPHHATISLPPPIAAPAPLPPHLGGPPLHYSGSGSPRFNGSKSARAAASNSALAMKFASMGPSGSEHVPKFPSPLALPVFSKADEGMEGMSPEVEHEGDNVLPEENGMDLGAPLTRVRSSSPCGPPVHQEVASHLTSTSPPQSEWNDKRPLSAPLPPPHRSPSFRTDDDVIDEGFACSSPPRSSFLDSVDDLATSSYDITEIASTLRFDPARTVREGSVSPPPTLDPIVPNVSNFGGLGFMDVDVPSGLGLDTPGFPLAGTTQVFPDREDIDIDEDSLSALERIFLCARSELMNERCAGSSFRDSSGS